GAITRSRCSVTRTNERSERSRALFGIANGFRRGTTRILLTPLQGFLKGERCRRRRAIVVPIVHESQHLGGHVILTQVCEKQVGSEAESFHLSLPTINPSNRAPTASTQSFISPVASASMFLVREPPG